MGGAIGTLVLIVHQIQYIPLDEYPEPQAFLGEARALTDKAQAQGLVLRVMGPIAIHSCFPDCVDLYQRMERLGERVFPTLTSLATASTVLS